MDIQPPKGFTLDPASGLYYSHRIDRSDHDHSWCSLHSVVQKLCKRVHKCFVITEGTAYFTTPNFGYMGENYGTDEYPIYFFWTGQY